MESDDNDDKSLLCRVITGFIDVIASFDDDDIFLRDMPKSLMITGLIDVIALDDTTMTKPLLFSAEPCTPLHGCGPVFGFSRYKRFGPRA